MSENASPPPAAAAPPPAAETAGSPAEFLKNVVGKEVKVRIGHGIDYQGTFPLRHKRSVQGYARSHHLRLILFV